MISHTLVLECCILTIGVNVLVSDLQCMSLYKMIPELHMLFAADTTIQFNKTSCYMQPVVSG